MQYYVHHDGQQLGPLSLEEVRTRLANGSFQSTDLGWHEGAAGWVPLAEIPALSAEGAPPPVPAVRPTPQSAVGTYAPPGAGAFGQPTQTSGLAIASLVLGLSTLLLNFLTAIPAVICGHLALSQIKKSAGAFTGRGMALTGLIIGYFWVALLPIIVAVGILAGIALPVFNQVNLRGTQTKALAEAKQIGLALKLYAGDHDGKYPDRLEQIIPEYMTDDHLFTSPLGKDRPAAEKGYDYFGKGLTDGDAPSTVLLKSQAHTTDHKHVVIHLDCSGEMQRE